MTLSQICACDKWLMNERACRVSRQYVACVVSGVDSCAFYSRITVLAESTCHPRTIALGHVAPKWSCRWLRLSRAVAADLLHAQGELAQIIVRPGVFRRLGDRPQ